MTARSLDERDSPVTAWLTWVDAFAAGADPPTTHLPALADGAGDARVVVLHRLVDAFTHRADAWADDLRRRVADPTVTSPAALAEVLHQSRRRLRPLTALAEAPAVPEEIREPMSELLSTLRTSAQRSLEDSVKGPRPHPALEAVVRDHSLLIDDAAHGGRLAPSPPLAPAAPSGRRVIL